jgi:hypothetical protein
MSVDSLPDRTHGPISYTVNPESLRVVVYVFFSAIMLVGYLITTTFSEHAIHHNTLKDLWGYNNLCVVLASLSQRTSIRKNQQARLYRLHNCHVL